MNKKFFNSSSKRLLCFAVSAVMLFTAACSSQPAASQPVPSAQPTVSSSAAAPSSAAPAQKEPAELPKPTVEGKDAYSYNGMVAAADKQAAQAGLEILKSGGNAADAAVAAAFALGLTEPAASGIGGSGMAICYDAATGKTTAFNYSSEVPAKTTLEHFADTAADIANGNGGKHAVVGGAVAGLCKVNELFGSMPLADVMAPAIKMAEEGVEVTSFMESTYMDSYYNIIAYPETERVYTYDGVPYMEGDIFTNPDYGKALKLIAENGPDVYYKGEIAQAIVDSVAEAGGHITLEDMAGYNVQVSEPVHTTYRGYDVYSIPPCAGGAPLMNMLNMAELFDLPNIEYGSAEYTHLMGEICRLAMSYEPSTIEDPDYYPMDRAKGMVTKAYARVRADLINEASVLPDNMIGDPYEFAHKEDPETHTTSLAVIDKDGNMVAMTNTNSSFCGSFITCKDYGFFIQNSTSFELSNPDYYPEPGKKVRSSMSPYLVFDPEGNSFLAGGTPGATRIIPTNALIVSQMIDYDADLQTVLGNPRLYKGPSGNLNLEGGFSETVIEQLKTLGHTVTVRPENDSYFGGVHAVHVADPESGLLHGAADPRRSGVAVGY